MGLSSACVWCMVMKSHENSYRITDTLYGETTHHSAEKELSPGHTVPIWRSRSLRSEKSWTSTWSAHEVVATSYWHLGSLLGREKIGSDREASTTKFYCKTLSCWSWRCYDLFMGRFQSCVQSETSWDCRTQREGIRGQRVGIRRQRMDAGWSWSRIGSI